MTGAFFKPEKSSNNRAVQVRVNGKNAGAIGGQRAHDLRIGPQPEYVDLNRAHLNRIIITPQTGTQLRKICEERRSLRTTARAMKSTAAVGMVGIITFGNIAQVIFEDLTLDQQDEAYRETAEAVAKRLNTTLTGLVVHGDESAPHAHFQLPAYDLTGHPVSETAKRGVMRDLQTITAEVMGRHAPGIERGRSKVDRLKAGASPAEVINRSVAQLHEELPLEIAQKQARLMDIDSKIKKNERLATRALEKAAANEEKAEKALKNAALYEGRAEKARQERAVEEQAIKLLQAKRQKEEERLEALKAEATHLRAAAKADIRAARLEASEIRNKATREAQEAADAILERAHDKGVKEALRVTEEVAKRLEEQLLTDGQQALRKVERERDSWKTAFELLRDAAKSLVPANIYQTVRDHFIGKWSKHPDNPDRKPESPRPSYYSGPSGP